MTFKRLPDPVEAVSRSHCSGGDVSSKRLLHVRERRRDVVRVVSVTRSSACAMTWSDSAVLTERWTDVVGVGEVRALDAPRQRHRQHLIIRRAAALVSW
jgi:hypothetical protein